ncbi:MAG: presenilin family intramembrane aspartyl protease [Candidatus Woesearchaeota archaeon]
MKHPVTPTVLLLILFVASQIIGLGILALNAETTIDEEGVVSVSFSEPITGERPETTSAGIFVYLVIGITLGTIALLLMARFQARLLWKAWYMLAVALTVATALGVLMNAWVAWGIGILAAVLKAQKPGLLIHNVTEIFIHAGIAFIIVPLLNVWWAVAMLIAIAVYDAYAVWKSKHMVSLANFMTDTKLFAGLSVPYKKPTVNTKKPARTPNVTKQVTVRSAILGGGDIAFPLLFSGVVLHTLITNGVAVSIAFLYTLIITVCAAISLTWLFLRAKKDTFYPAMPFLSAACLVGYGIIILLL